MASQGNLVTIYRSADSNAETDATAVRNLLIKGGLNPELLDDKAPGVVPGSWEVRVPEYEVPNAESVLAGVDQDDPGAVDPSHGLDLVTIARTFGSTGQMEALGIKSILDANGINAVIIGNSTLPNLSFFVRVAKDDVALAEKAIAEARAAGPAAALEAQQESEGQP
jgi:hypothetical protein